MKSAQRAAKGAHISAQALLQTDGTPFVHLVDVQHSYEATEEHRRSNAVIGPRLCVQQQAHTNKHTVSRRWAKTVSDDSQLPPETMRSVEACKSALPKAVRKPRPPDARPTAMETAGLQSPAIRTR